jgi:hypothetical protein
MSGPSGLSRDWCLGVSVASASLARTRNAGAVRTASRQRTQPEAVRAEETRHPFLRQTTSLASAATRCSTLLESFNQEHA